MLWYFALGLLAVSAFVHSDEEIMKNLTFISWAHAVNNKTYLEAALASEVSMLEADIVLGHLHGSEEGPAIPIMAHPPATTSDLSLADFLATVAKHNKGRGDKAKGVKLDFKMIEAFEQAQEQIAVYTKKETFPIWLNADILPGPIDATTKPVDPVKFLKLGAQHPKAVMSIGWTTHYGGKHITEGEYTRNHVGSMVRLVNENHITQTVTFPVRAGLASNSQPVLLDLLRETSSTNSTLTVWSSEGDHVEVDRLRALLLTVGLERTYLDVPAELASRIKLPAQ